jgi:hypothetical protein
MSLHPDPRRGYTGDDELITRRETYEVSHRVPTSSPSTAQDPRWKALTAVVGVLGGAALIVLGVVAVARSDLEGSMNVPVIEVAGWPHSPLLGVLQIAAGAALVVVSLSSVGELLVSAVIAGFGVIALIEPQVLDDRLNIHSTHAWLLVGLGSVGLLAALVSYVMSRSPSDRAAELDPYGL